MPKKHNLTKRGDVWYYRRRVPQGLEKAMGQSVVQFSLKTKDFKVAARMRDELEVEWNGRFDVAARQSNNPEQSKAALSHHEALRIVREYVRETGHASDAMLSRYIRDGELFVDNAAGVLL